VSQRAASILLKDGIHGINRIRIPGLLLSYTFPPLASLGEHVPVLQRRMRKREKRAAIVAVSADERENEGRNKIRRRIKLRPSYYIFSS
jgi:hypothetical protein